MNRLSKTVLSLAVIGACALGIYLAVRKSSDRQTAAVELRDWRSRQLAGLTLEAPGDFQSTPLNLGPAQEFVASSEMQVFKTAGFEIDVLRMAYKEGVDLSFDGAVQGAVNGIAQLDGIRNLKHTATELTVSGKPARRLSITAERWRKSLRVEVLIIADGQALYQVQAVFDASNPRGLADADRLLQSVKLGS